MLERTRRLLELDAALRIRRDETLPAFERMNEAVKEESVGLLFHVDVQVDQPTEAPVMKFELS